MYHTVILTEKNPTNTLSPNIYFSDFSLLETTLTTQEITATPNNAETVVWSKLFHQKLTIYPTIAALTRKYCDACEKLAIFHTPYGN